MAVTVTLVDAPKAWELDAPDDLWEAGRELAALGYRGGVDWAKPDAGSEPVFRLVLNAENGVGAEVIALVGDRLLLAGGVLRRLSAEEYSEVTA